MAKVCKGGGERANQGDVMGAMKIAPLLHFPSTCSGTSPLANAGKCFLSRKGRDTAAAICAPADANPAPNVVLQPGANIRHYQ
jgi:hypothetical protein